MNKLLYRLIFNKKRGQLMAVSELVSGGGKSSTRSCAKTMAVSLSQRLRPLNLSVLLCFMLPIDALAQIHADRTAPANQQAMILQTANGLPQINIQTPTAAGVSMNQYRQFDVGEAGAVLNNSRRATATQMAGWVQGNPHLARGEAKVIVNQVNSRDPSHLNGFLEVAGRRAEVVVANPAGIMVNGGGFINARGVTLSTGQTQLDQHGRLSGLSVQQGTVRVGDKGLNTQDANYTQIIAKAAEINGAVWANDLTVSVGEQVVSFEGEALNQSAKLKQQIKKALQTQELEDVTHDRSTSEQEVVGVDVSQLGGMYANSIVLLSTDKGVGVNNAGQLYAGRGHLHLSADGRLTNQGEIVASGTAGESAAELHLHVGAIQNQGVIASSTIHLKADQVRNEGGLVAARDELNSQSKELINRDNGQIVAGRLVIETDDLLNQASTLLQMGNQALVITANDLVQQGELRRSEVSIESEPQSVEVSTVALLDSGEVFSGKTNEEQPNKRAHDVELASGSIRVSDSLHNDEKAVLVAQGDVHVKVLDRLDNQGLMQVNTLQASGTLLRNQGKIDVERLNSVSQQVDNRQGQLIAANELSVVAETVDNREGEMSVTGPLRVTATELSNQDGQLFAKQSVTVDMANRLDNRRGMIASQEQVSVQAFALDNRHGQIHAAGALSIEASQAIENQSGELLAGQTVNLIDSASNLEDRALVIEQDEKGIIYGEAGINMVAHRLQSDASLATPGDLRVDVVADLSNSSGLGAGGDLSVTTRGQLLNEDMIYAGRGLTLQGANINNRATGEMVGEERLLVTATSGSLVNRGLMNSQGLTRIDVADTLHNIGTGRIYGDHVAIQAKRLVNREEEHVDGSLQSAVIAGRERVDLGIAQLHNQEEALIFSGGDLALGRRLNELNLAEGRADAILNQSATIESLGDMSLNAGTITNENTHFALERVQVGDPKRMEFVVHEQNSYDTKVDKKHLKERKWSRRATEFVSKTPADYAQLVPGETPLWSLENSCHSNFGVACYLPTKLTNFDKYPADNPAWAYFGITPATETEPIAPRTPTQPLRGAALAEYQQVQREYEEAYAAWMAGDGQRWHALADALRQYNKNYQHRFKYRYTEYWITRREYEDRIASSRPGDLIAGGNLTIKTDTLVNDKSRIVAGQALDATAQDIQQIDGKGLKIIEDKGTSRYSWARWRGGFRRYHQRRYGREVPFESVEQQHIDLPVSVYQGYTRVDSNTLRPEKSYDAGSATSGLGGQDTFTSLETQSALNGLGSLSASLSQKEQASASLVVVTNGLQRIHQGANPYLIETDPAFTNRRQWLSSDYMLQAMSLDPARMMKRLGDGYYEQALLREQILQATGQRFLAGHTNDEEQFKALMSAGVTFAKAHDLVPGVSLSPAQMAQLTSDIVWLETQTVALADGTRQQVLVPRLYVRAQPGDLSDSGALLAGQSVRLQVTDGFTNSGTVAGRELVTIDAATISQHLGQVQGKRVALTAKQDMQLDGTSIRAEEQAYLQAGNDLHLSSTTYQTAADVRGERGAHFSGERQGIDRLTQVVVRDEQAQLLLSAANDLTLDGALVTNLGHQGQTTLVAGRDLNLATVTTGYRQDSVADARNYVKEASWQEVGTAVHTAGDMQLQAGGDVQMRAAQLNSEQGQLSIAAAGDIHIEAGHATSQHDERRFTKRRSLLGSRSRDIHVLREREEAIPSEITAATVWLQSGQDVNIVGSDMISDHGTHIVAGGDLQLSAAKERAFSAYHEEKKRSGVFGTGGLGITIGKQSTRIDHDRSDVILRGSVIGSLDGDTVLQAGQQYQQEASTVSSPRGHTLIAGQSVTITAGEQPYTEGYQRRDKRSGLTVAVNVPIVDAARAIQHAAESIGESSNRRTQAMAAANTAWRFYEGVGQVTGQPVGMDAAKRVHLSATLGSQKSHLHEQQTGVSVAPSHVLAAETATILAQGAGPKSSIDVVGSDVIGARGTHLLADGSLNLRSVREEASLRSTNRSSGWNAGIALSIDQGVSFGVTAGTNRATGHRNADRVNHRQTQIGDSGSLTRLVAGESATLQGAQVRGEQIQLQTPSLRVVSVQDSAHYDSKQQSLGGQLTVGYGVSGSAHVNRSHLTADYASVITPSGLYAGDGGYQVDVAQHTELVGALVTSSAAAEQAGRNRFATGTLSVSDLNNYSQHRGSAIGLGAQGELAGGWSGTTVSSSGEATHTAMSGVGYGRDRETHKTVTASGINTENLVIRDGVAQQLLTGLSPEAMADRVYTPLTTDASPAGLENHFNENAIQRELATQVAVSQDFSRNVQAAKGELNRATERLESQYDAGELSREDYVAGRERLQGASRLLSVVAAGLQAPTAEPLGIVAASMSPIVAHEIGQYFKANQAAGGAGEGSVPHLLAHGVLAAAAAAAGGQEAVTAATAAVGAEVAAPLLAQYLYGKTPQTLSADEKTTISAITGFVGAGVGTLSGSDASLVQATQSAMTAVEENQFSGVGNLFGVNKWGPAVGSLVNHRTQTSDVLDLDQLTDELAALRRGDGFDNGVTDGIILISAAPIIIGGGAAVVSVVGGGAALGAYGVAAGKSVGQGVATSLLVFDEDYKLSNLIYDASVGVAVGNTVDWLIKINKLEGISKKYFIFKGELANFSFGSGVGSAASNHLQDKDLILVPRTGRGQNLKGKSHD